MNAKFFLALMSLYSQLENYIKVCEAWTFFYFMFDDKLYKYSTQALVKKEF